MKLDSFVYVKNARFNKATHSVEMPQYWVGRIAEIIRGGRVRLHWHVELKLGSGLYAPTNNFFVENAALLNGVTRTVYDKKKKAFQIYPILERPGAALSLIHI